MDKSFSIPMATGFIVALAILWSVDRFMLVSSAQTNTFCVIVQEQNGIVVCHYPGLNVTQFYKCDSPQKEEFGISCTQKFKGVAVKQNFLKYVPPKAEEKKEEVKPN